MRQFIGKLKERFMMFSTINPWAKPCQAIHLNLFRVNLLWRFNLRIKNFCKDVSDFLSIFVMIRSRVPQLMSVLLTEFLRKIKSLIFLLDGKTLSHPLYPSLISLKMQEWSGAMLIELRKGMTLHPCTLNAVVAPEKVMISALNNNIELQRLLYLVREWQLLTSSLIDQPFIQKLWGSQGIHGSPALHYTERGEPHGPTPWTRHETVLKSQSIKFQKC